MDGVFDSTVYFSGNVQNIVLDNKKPELSRLKHSSEPVDVG